jgi:CheY-like chemotaxis protein
MESKRILIVDDDKVTLKALESILMRAGYAVTPISLGKEAIRIARTDSIDLIILDIMMPDMDGGEVAHILKNDPETQDIPIIFLSSLITKKEEKSSSKREGICLSSKPYDRDELLRQIRNYLYLKP